MGLCDPRISVANASQHRLLKRFSESSTCGRERVVLHGLTRGEAGYLSTERCAHLRAGRSALRAGASDLPVDIRRPVSLVPAGGLLRDVRDAHVLRYRRLSSLLFTSLV